MEPFDLLLKNSLVVLAAPHAARDRATALVAQLSSRGSVTVLDNGNRFQPYRLARLIRSYTRQIEQAANRVFVRRAFTCYQTLALLESTPGLSAPCVVLDLLATFYDENIAEKETARVFNACVREIKRLTESGPMVITLAPPRLEQRAFLLEEVYRIADEVVFESLPSVEPAHKQLGLFSEVA